MNSTIGSIRPRFPSTREFAKENAKRGWKVFRLPPDRKEPPLVDGWQTMPANPPAAVKSLWTDSDGRSTDHNIAIQTGLGFIVLDFDSRHGGDRSLAALEPLLPDTYRVRTPGGTHVYLAHSEAVSGGSNVLGHHNMPGVDLRAHNGYVVGEGSVVDGKPYVLDAGCPDEIAPAPKIILEMLGDRRVRPRTEQHPVSELDSDEAFQLASAWLASPDGLNGESCDGRTFRTAARLKDFGISEDAAVEMLCDHEQRLGDVANGEHFERAIRNAYTYAGENPPGIEVAKLAHNEFEPVPGDDGPRPETVPMTADVIALRPPSSVSKSGESRIKLERDDEIAISSVEWLVRDLLPAGSLTVLYGEPESYKSFVALHMAAMLARSAAVFGKQSMRPQSQPDVVYIAAEGGFGIGKRLAALKLLHGDSDHRIHVVRRALDLRSSRKDAQELTDVVAGAGLRPCLLVVDTMARTFGGGAENSPEDMGRYIGILDELRGALNCAVLLVHHTGKDTTRGMRGHSSLHGAADTELLLRKMVPVGSESFDAVGAVGLKMPKQKDDAPVPGLDFAVQRVFLRWSEDAAEDLGGLKDQRHAITSLAVRDWKPGEARPGVRVLDRLTDHAREVLGALREIAPGGSEIGFKAAGQSVRRRLPDGRTDPRVWRELEKAGAIVRDKGRDMIAVATSFAAEADAAEDD